MKPVSPRSEGSRCGDCLGAAVHRLAQHLTALRGSLELALTFEESVETYRAAVERALDQLDALSALLEYLREYEGGSEAAAPTVVRLDEVVRETGEEWRALHSDQGVEIVVEAPGPAPVIAEPQRLRSAIARLLQAALNEADRHGIVRLATGIEAGQAFLTLNDEWAPAPTEAFEVLPESRTPGEAFADAAKGGQLNWFLAQNLVEATGASIEITVSPEGGRSVRARWASAPQSAT